MNLDCILKVTMRNSLKIPPIKKRFRLSISKNMFIVVIGTWKSRICLSVVPMNRKKMMKRPNKMRMMMKYRKNRRNNMRKAYLSSV